MNTQVLIILGLAVLVITALIYVYLYKPEVPEKEVLSFPQETANYTPTLPENITPTEIPEKNKSTAENTTLPEINESELTIELPDEI